MSGPSPIARQDTDAPAKGKAPSKPQSRTIPSGTQRAPSKYLVAQLSRSSIDVVRYKTKLCWHFEQGTCPHGKRCAFAHGAQDLRPADDEREPPEDTAAAAPKKGGRKPAGNKSAQRTSLKSPPREAALPRDSAGASSSDVDQGHAYPRGRLVRRNSMPQLEEDDDIDDSQSDCGLTDSWYGSTPMREVPSIPSARSDHSPVTDIPSAIPAAPQAPGASRVVMAAAVVPMPVRPAAVCMPSAPAMQFLPAGMPRSMVTSVHFGQQVPVRALQPAMAVPVALSAPCVATAVLA
eukprot:TRINITY_DN52653_c0_g1_i1.p1 TRINITY_DN52653_c0_g1~~TRINITY_DN52653_c0_g1_i1.p1  ORF type:complete len:324 (+),score=69.71 TRINITY_DN52653_c0_g1_i1:98-973(+)